jgi:two-component system chemotaxis response regulator CheB
MPARKIKVLVVDDSAVSRASLTHELETDPAFEVVGNAHSGAEAIAALEHSHPDVVTMDIHMPGMDGFETTRQIMETHPLPIVIVSASYHASDVAKAFRAMEAGAVAAIEKPPGINNPGHAAAVRKFISTVKAMSEVRVVKRWKKKEPSTKNPQPAIPLPSSGDIRLVALGASTGGPPAIQKVLAGLPKPFPVPILIVQHISAGFVEGLAEWLATSSAMPVRIARNGEIALPGTAYIAPDGSHMGVDRECRILCSQEPAEHGLRPAVSFLFRSVARSHGAQAAGVLLTGMGRDGAEELKAMRDKGAVTIAQDKESSIVHGMPGEAIRIGAAVHVGDPERIALLLRSLVGNDAHSPSPSIP